MKIQIVPLKNDGSRISTEYSGLSLSSCGYWYLHGELWKDNGYDLALAVLTPENSKTVELNDKDLYINGEVDVEVFGCNRLCKGFFYTLPIKGSWIQRGLVCYADDKEACKYAYDKMINKSDHI